MKLIQIKPAVHQIATFKAFTEEFNVCETDCILTVRFLHDTFMKNLNLKSEYMFYETYGSGEPSDEMIDAMLSDIRKKNIKRIIAVGGGSVIDIAKLLVLKNTGNALNFFEKSVEIKKEKELVLIPTTCGTGSEVTNISIAEIKSKHTKMGLALDELFGDQAILIPELVVGLPFEFFATSSIDALIHAMESFVSPRSNSTTELFSVQAMEMILSGYKEIIEKGKDHRKNLIDKFLLASNYAGIAFGNTGVGAVHALSYPLGGSYHVPHGEANYQFLTEVFKTYQKKNPTGKITKITELLGKILGFDHNRTDAFAELSKLLDQLISRKPLKEYGMKESEIESFAEGVIKGQQRLLVNNYVPLSQEEIRDIFKALY